MNKLRYELAKYIHDEAWSGWMKCLLSQCDPIIYSIPKPPIVDRKGVKIPEQLVQRWERQMNTPFDDLPEDEKKSDYKEADRIMEIIKGGKDWNLDQENTGWKIENNIKKLTGVKDCMFTEGVYQVVLYNCVAKGRQMNTVSRLRLENMTGGEYKIVDRIYRRINE